MELWTHDELARWRRWTDAVRGLDAVTSSPPSAVRLVVLARGPDEDEAVFAATRLARRLTTEPLEIIAGTPSPTLVWLESAIEAGVDQAALFAWDQGGHQEPPLQGAAELSHLICPALHARREQSATLSVCGRHHDRMVLARHHFDRWCLATKEECPHWRGGRDE